MENGDTRKVVQMLTHSMSSLFPGYQVSENLTTQQYEGGWHSKLSRQIQKYYPGSEIEVWGMEKNLKAPFSFKKDGITYRIFPSIRVGYLGEISFPMLGELKRLREKDHIVVHLHGIFKFTTYAIPLLVKDTPVVVQHHGDMSRLQFFRQHTKDNWLKAFAYLLLYLFTFEWFFERTSLTKLDRLFMLDNASIAYLSKIVGPSRVEKLSMGIDFDLFKKMDKNACRESLGLDLNKKYLLYVGTFVRLKGLDYLLRAHKQIMADYPDATLIMIGDGYQRDDLEAFSRSLGTEKNVLFYPWIDNKKLPYFYNAADVCVQTSLQEGLPVVALEVLACGRPFIGTNVGAIPDIIKNFGAGTLIPVKDVDATVNAIRKYFSGGEDVKVDIENAKKYYSWENIIRRINAVYDEVWERHYG